MKKFFMFLARTFKTTRGNWYKPNRWSDCARRLRDSGARRISRGDRTSRLDVAVKNITNDLYWGVFPGEKGRTWRNNPDMVYDLENEVRTLIERLNSYDLYLDWYSGELWLVKFHCSMPVGKFLAYFKGSNDTAQRYVNDALSEWTGMDEEEINKLWVSYKSKKDIEIRDKLIEHYLPIVNIIAGTETNNINVIVMFATCAIATLVLFLHKLFDNVSPLVMIIVQYLVACALVGLMLWLISMFVSPITPKGWFEFYRSFTIPYIFLAGFYYYRVFSETKKQDKLIQEIQENNKAESN